MRTSTSAAWLIVLASLVSCDSSGGSASTTSYVDESIEDFQSLGWLGAYTQPLNETLTLKVDDERRSVGGVVLRRVVEGPLAKLGAQVADVIVRVEDDWIPVTSDMDLIVLEYVERAISSGATSVELGCWRAGSLVSFEVPVDRVALEVGLPVEVERFSQAADLAIQRLVALQKPHGGYSHRDEAGELAVDAIVGLAMVSAGLAGETAGAYSVALDKLDKRIRALALKSDSSVEGRIYSLMYQCERVGPLPAKVLVAASEAGGGGKSSPLGAPDTATVMQAGSLADLQEMMKKMGGSMTMTVETSGGPIPAGAQPVITKSVSSKSGPAAADASLEKLLADLAPKRIATNTAVAPAVKALVDVQDESGHWGGAEADPFDRYLLTCHALVALGMAQRIGLDVPADAVQRGVEAMRSMVDDGKLAALVARGADRREEAGRAAHGAWALLALGVTDRDEFRELLLDFSDSGGKDVLRAPRAVALHVWAVAATRRARGLAEWQSFYDDFRVWLVAQQSPEGGFRPSGTDANSFEVLGGEALATAIGVQLLSFQSVLTPVLLARAENPLAPKTDGHGKREGGEAEPPEAPELGDGETMIITDPAEAAKLLKSLGIDPPSADGATPPDGG